MPPTLTQEKLGRLAELADRIDGAQPGQWEDGLAEFNRQRTPAFAFRVAHWRSEAWSRRLLPNFVTAVVTKLTTRSLREARGGVP
jgi:hypothetical protein